MVLFAFDRRVELERPLPPHYQTSPTKKKRMRRTKLELRRLPSCFQFLA